MNILGCGNDGKSTQDLRCQIQSVRKSYYVGEPLEIKIFTKNLSDRKITITTLREGFTKDSHDLYYTNNVHGFWRFNLEKTHGIPFKHGFDPITPQLKLQELITLEPGGIFEKVFYLDRGPFRILPIGTYRIYAEYIGWQKEGTKQKSPLNWFGKVTSGPIYFKIIPRSED